MLFVKVVTVKPVNRSQNGRSEEDKNRFYDDQNAEVQSRNGNCILHWEILMDILDNW